MGNDEDDTATAIRDLIRVQREIATQQRMKQIAIRDNAAGYMFQMTTFAILTSAFSFVGAFVIRDFFKNSIEGFTKRFKLPSVLSNILYIVIVLSIVVPLLILISIQKSKAEAEEAERINKIYKSSADAQKILKMKF